MSDSGFENLVKSSWEALMDYFSIEEEVFEERVKRPSFVMVTPIEHVVDLQCGSLQG